MEMFHTEIIIMYYYSFWGILFEQHIFSSLWHTNDKERKFLISLHTKDKEREKKL